MIEDIQKLTLTTAVSEVKKGNLKKEDLIDAHIAVIEKHGKETEKPINATLYTDKASALKQENLKENSKEENLLAGVPISIKRNMNLKGFPMDCCSKILEGYVAPYTATAIENLINRGGTVFSNTNMDEFAMGSANQNSIYGMVRNPINRDYVPGGSSGGPAAAVCSGEALAALGTDTGGSIRQPAACCGVVGLKPTYGRVSRYGIVAFASSFDQVGPITKTVADSALLLQAISGHDERDSTSANVPVPDFSAKLNDSLQGKVMGLPREYFGDDVNPQILRQMETVKTFYREAGVTFKELSLPATIYGLPVYYVLATAEASTNLARFDGVRYGRRGEKIENLHDLFFRTRSEGFGAEVKRRLFMGGYVLSAGYYDAFYLKALQVRRAIYNEYQEALKECDMLLTPTVPYPIFRVDERHEDPVQMYLSDVFTIAANLVGLPAISVPCGKDEKGLPMGLQLIGRTFGESEIFNAAHLYEKNNPFSYL